MVLSAVTLAIALGVIAAADAAAPDANSGEAPFPAENRVAMDKMMAGMDTDIGLSGRISAANGKEWFKVHGSLGVGA